LPAALFFRFQNADWTARSAGCSIRLAQVGAAYSITSPAIASSVGGTVKSGRLGGSSFDDRLDSCRLREGQACHPTRAANLFRFQLSF